MGCENQLPVISCLKVATEHGNLADVGRWVFQGARVFDGQYVGEIRMWSVVMCTCGVVRGVYDIL